MLDVCQHLGEKCHAGVVSHVSKCGDLQVHSACIYLFELAISEHQFLSSFHYVDIILMKRGYRPGFVLYQCIVGAHGGSNPG